MIRKVMPFIFCAFSLILNGQNQNLSNGFVFDGEPYITVNPNNSQHLVVAWMGWKLSNIIVIKTRASFDAGLTWSTTNTIPHVVSSYQSADPSLAFDNNGNVFLSYVDYSPSPIAGAVYITKSTDGGLNWGTPVEVINANADGTQLPVDRPWIAIDNSGGPYDGNIYITTMNPNVFGPVTPPYNPYFIRSTDSGASFDPWRYMDTTNWLAGNLIPQPMPTPCVTADGTFHAVYPSWYIPQGLSGQYIVASSSNAGNAFTHHSVMQVTQTNSDSLPKKGYKLTSNPADPNHLLLAYPNFDNGDIDVYIVESLNGGNTWGTPVRVNDDPIGNNRMQDLIWVDFDTDGDVVVTWRDRRNSPDSTYTTNSEIWGAVRWKDSTNFSTNFVLTDSSITYNSVLANNGNDFMCVNMINDTVYAVWGDTRNNFLNIWFQQIDLSSGATLVQDLANDITPIVAFPNPTTGVFKVDIGDNLTENSKYEILNLLGETLESNNINKKIIPVDLSNYPKGAYLFKFTNVSGSKLIKLIRE